MSKPDTETGHLAIDFRNMLSLEVALLEIAHDAAVMSDNQQQQTMGRLLKTLAPAWIAAVKGECDRNENKGPGHTLYGLTRAFAFLTSLTAAGSARNNAKSLNTLIKPLSSLFQDDLKTLMSTYKQKDEEDEDTTRN